VTLSTQKDLAERWSASGKKFPTATFFTLTKMVTWNEASEVPFDEAGLLAFAKGALDGTYESNMKSEPIPEEHTEGQVTVIVGKNLDKTMKNEEKDLVLIEFYAPWCGFCKKIAPVYDELAAKFKNENVIIGKIDATANSIGNVEIQGYPTIIGFSKGVPKLYEGSHDLESLSQFVESFLKKENTEEKPEL